MNQISRCKPFLGTYVELSLYGKYSDDELIQFSDAAFARIEWIHSQLSFHDPASELTSVNRHLLCATPEPLPISDELREILTLAMALFDKTEGLYDISVAGEMVSQGELPDHFEINFSELGNGRHLKLDHNGVCSHRPICIDLGGIAKGFAVDAAYSTLPEDVDCVINAGGDMLVTDWKEQEVSLRYGVREGAVKQKRMANRGVATSGDYYREGHAGLIHPRRRKQQKYQGSISVFASTVVVADALTKALRLVDHKTRLLLLDYFSAEMIMINRFGMSKHIKR